MRIKLNIPAPHGGVFAPEALHYQPGMRIPFQIGADTPPVAAEIVGARAVQEGRAMELELEVDLTGLPGLSGASERERYSLRVDRNRQQVVDRLTEDTRERVVHALHRGARTVKDFEELSPGSNVVKVERVNGEIRVLAMRYLSTDTDQVPVRLSFPDPEAAQC